MSRQGSAGAERPLQEHYLAATATELKIATVPRRFAAVADARLLFPHSGSIEVTHDVLELRGWRTLRAREIAIVSRAYIPEYNRFTAGGVRGGFPSLGAVRRAGAPLVLDLRNRERIVLLIGYDVVSGVTKNSSWLVALQRFVAG